jgi:hypothetical protein
MSAVSSALKFTARTGWVFAGTLLGFTLFGLVLNLVFFFLLPDRCAIQGSVGAIISDCADAVLIGLLFLPIFPILYGILAYRLAIQRSVHFAYVQNRESLLRYVIDKFVGFAQKHGGNSVANVGSMASNFFNRLDNLPFALRSIIGVLKKVVPMADIFDKIDVQQIAAATTNRDELVSKVSAETDRYLKSELLDPDTTLPTILVAANILLFVLLKWGL